LKRVRILFAIFLLLSFGCIGRSQGDIGIVAGISNYQGDLPSYSTSGGFRALIGPVIGLHAGLEQSPLLHFRADLLYTRVSGDDALAEKEITRLRNLSFFSPLVQLAVGADIHITGFTQRNKQDFSPYASVGASVFYFSPRTVYEGKTIALRPLGTEGQFLDDYPDQKPYSPVQPTLQFGGGLRFLPSSNLIIAVEAMLSVTFTDYLDDASTIYISYPELLDKAGPLTAALANREGELLGTEPVVVPTGSLRANAKTKDLFGVITLRISKPFKITSSKFRVRTHNKKRIDCPKF
jgi:hypothetical protein